jgi:hypothetical protein
MLGETHRVGHSTITIHSTPCVAEEVLLKRFTTLCLVVSSQRQTDDPETNASSFSNATRFSVVRIVAHSSTAL